MSAQINPSILAADFANFERELGHIASADAAHVDVMDNHFVPNLTFGQPMVERLQAVSPIPLDLHLMIEDPDRWAPDFAAMGVWSVTFHAEAATAPVTLAKKLRAAGARAGIALRPGTPFSAVEEILGSFDQLLIMTVEPGFGGQRFMTETMPKLRQAHEFAKRTGLELQLQVDGGITTDTIGIAAEHGADTFVAGSAVFRGEPAEQIEALRQAAAQHTHE
ncbi:ribulose-phosphate 3-epimerase [Pseudoclavibacter albus]|uniref:ribulose-phosphate 3-epimerase n=1 Tax=Pseudoclavibacter albus TaxID=272241 RepID=UPI0008257E1C|nr:ribulose-phosphate 3-epimerase [Pseudoclavibacter alba]